MISRLAIEPTTKRDQSAENQRHRSSPYALANHLHPVSDSHSASLTRIRGERIKYGKHAIRCQTGKELNDDQQYKVDRCELQQYQAYSQPQQTGDQGILPIQPIRY